VFVYLFGFSSFEATHYSLFVVGVAALLSIFLGTKTHPVEKQALFQFGIPSMLSVVVVRKFVLPELPDEVLRVNQWVLLKEDLILSLFGFLMVLASASMLRDAAASKLQNPSGFWARGLVVLQGVCVGAVTGFVGAGGGFLITPALVRLHGLNLKSAVGTSLAIVAINSLMGFVASPAVVPFEVWKVLGFCVLFSVIGMLVAKQFSNRISERSLKKVFAGFIFIIGLFLIISKKI
jgi:uncharacterized membrane protein YfcA